jgi:hypothetical protein
MSRNTGTTLLALMLGVTATAVAAPLSTRQIAADVSKATVSIRSALVGGSVSAGSGFITDPSGIVVTNYHVVQGAERIEVRVASGETYDVTAIRAVDRRRDIAILQIPGFKLPTVTLGDSESLGPCESIVVIGNALGVLENSVTTGVVSGIRDVEGTKLIQMSAAVSPGNSGGPVVNERGEVVAITVSKLTAGESLNFAIPINFARGYLAQPAQQGLALLKATADDKDLFAKSSAGFPKRWRSLTSDTLRNITISEDAMLVEVVVPDVMKSYRRSWSELKKSNEQWVGTIHNEVICVYKQSFPVENKQNSCSTTFPIEVTLMSQTKIEGAWTGPPPDAKFDCRKCAMDKPPVKQNFIWIPAND